MFTGGTEIGRKVYEGAAPHLTPARSSSAARAR